MKTKQLIESKDIIIRERFLVHLSKMDTGAINPTYLLIINDLMERNFKMKYFKTEIDVVEFLKLLQSV